MGPRLLLTGWAVHRFLPGKALLRGPCLPVRTEDTLSWARVGRSLLRAGPPCWTETQPRPTLPPEHRAEEPLHPVPGDSKRRRGGRGSECGPPTGPSGPSSAFPGAGGGAEEGLASPCWPRRVCSPTGLLRREVSCCGVCSANANYVFAKHTWQIPRCGTEPILRFWTQSGTELLKKHMCVYLCVHMCVRSMHNAYMCMDMHICARVCGLCVWTGVHVCVSWLKMVLD